MPTLRTSESSASDGVFLKATRIFRSLRNDSPGQAKLDLPETYAKSVQVDLSLFLTLFAAGNERRLISLAYKDAAR